MISQFDNFSFMRFSDFYDTLIQGLNKKLYKWLVFLIDDGLRLSFCFQILPCALNQIMTLSIHFRSVLRDDSAQNGDNLKG